MKQLFRRILSGVLAIAMAISCSAEVLALQTEQMNAASAGTINFYVTDVDLIQSESEQQCTVYFCVDKNVEVTSIGANFTISGPDDKVVLGAATGIDSFALGNGSNTGFSYAAGNAVYPAYNSDMDTYTIFSLPVTVSAGAKGDYDITFTRLELFDGEDEEYTLASNTVTATITVEESVTPPTETDDFEIYYTLDSTADTESTPDGYKEYDVSTDSGRTVTATVYLKNNKEETVLQAYDVYLTHDDNLTWGSVGGTGVIAYTGDASSTDGIKEAHIQFVSNKDAQQTLGITDPIVLGTITFTIADAAVYDDEMPITLVQGSAEQGEETTNIAIGGTSVGDATSYYPTVKQTVDDVTYSGAEVNTTYTVSYDANGGTWGDDVQAPTQTKQYKIDLTLDVTAPTRTGYTLAGWNTVADGSGTAYEEGASYTANAGTTLYAQWTLNTVAVTFNSNGGEGNMPAQSVSYNTQTALSTNTFTRTGYTFAGWNTVADGTGTSYADGANITVTAATTLYAQWSKNKYTVTWYNQDGTDALETDSNVEYGAAPSFDSDDPTKEATEQYTYTFAGWATSTNQESGTEESKLPTVSGETKYYAAFSKTERSYTVSFNMNGHGDAIADQTIVYNNTATAPTAPTAEHYTFGGWYTDSACTTVYDFTAKVTKNVTLYAKWTPVTYKVTFNANGGSESMEDQSFTYGVSQPLTTNGFTAPTGKTFVNWNTKADGSGTTYGAGESLMLSENITLYAQWAFVPYTVTVNESTNGSVSVNPAGGNYQAEITLTITPDPGYELDVLTVVDEAQNPVDVADNKFEMPASNVTVTATFKKSDLTVKVETPTNGTANIEAGDDVVTEKTDAHVGDTITLNVAPSNGYKVKSVTYIKTGDDTATAENATAGENNTYTFTMPAYGITVNVEFEVISYTIAFNGNDETTGSMNPITGVLYNADQTLTKNAYIKNGYDFDGWLYNGTTYEDEATVKNLTSTDGDTVTLVAQWTEATYNIKLNANNGGYVDGYTAPATYTFGTGATLPTGDNITKTGYDFAGWYADANFKDEAVTAISATDNGDKEFWAKWTKKVYNVTLDTDDGTIAEDKNVTEYTYGTEVTLPTINDITKPGYTFAGWYEDEGFTVGPVTGITSEDAEDKNYYAKWTPTPYTITLIPNGGTITADGWTKDDTTGYYSKTYYITDTVTLPTPTKDYYNFDVWNVGTTAEKWTAGTYNAGEYKEYYGNVTLTAQWNRAATVAVEEYKYAADGYWMIRVGATDLATGKEYKFDDQSMFYMEKLEDGSNASYMVGEGTAVFYTLIRTDYLVKDTNGNPTAVLTDEGYNKLTIGDVVNGSRATINYNGDVNGDNVINIADANVVYQMTLYGGKYYGNLTPEQRLAADMVMATDNADKRGSIKDVDAIVTIINTTN